MSSEPTTRCKCNCLRRLALVLAFLLVSLSACFFFRAPILRAAANAWIVNDPVPHADAIVILGGGLEYRPFAAAKLYSNLVHAPTSGTLNPQPSTLNSPVILITQPELPPTAEMGLTVPEQVLARQILLSNGVPASAIQPLGTNVTSTRDEALALKNWVQQNKARSILIPTDLFHTRRARWIFEKALRGTSVEVHPAAVNQPRYKADDWWKHEEGLIAFQNEVVKSIYYHLKY